LASAVLATYNRNAAPAFNQYRVDIRASLSSDVSRLLPALAAVLSVCGLVALGAAQNPPPPQPPAPQQPATPPPQQPPEPQQPIFRAKVELVRVDVSVTGRDEEPIEDLKAEDFEVEEDGFPQTVETAQFIRLTGQVPSDNRESIEIRSLDHGRREAAREDVRVFVIFLDDYHVDKAPQITLPLRRALEDFVKQLGPYDLMAVMEPLTPLTHVKFTRNREEVLAQMHAFEGRRGQVFPVKSAAEEAQLTARNLAEVRASVTLDALNAIVTHLGGLREGRKSVLFVSQGPPTGMSAASPNFSRLQEVLRNANRGNVTINCLDPRPLGAVGFGGDYVLRLLADTTGGRAIVNTNNPDDQLRKVIDDASAYYLVGYTPTRPVANDGKFHKISVKVKRRGLHVTSRQGYWAPSTEEMTPRFREPRPAEVTSALSDLIRPADGRDFDVWVGAIRGDGAGTRLLVTWDPTNRYGNSNPAKADVEILGEDGKPVGAVQTIAPNRQSGLPSVATLEAKPGATTIRFTVKTAAGDVIDQWREKVQVPSLAGKLALATPRFFRARTPFELRALETDPAPTPAASRRLRTTERVLVEVEAYSASTDPLELSAELLNQDGKMLVTLPVPALTGGKARITLPLSSLARSTYVLRIQAKSGELVARQLAPFEVVP
jgi:VWFA-related protein